MKALLLLPLLALAGGVTLATKYSTKHELKVDIETKLAMETTSMEMLKDGEAGALYLFTDPNQALYKRRAQLPVKEEPFYLTTNCRNTSPIHQAAYKYFEGEATDPPEIPGEDPALIVGSTIAGQAEGALREIRRLISVEGIKPAQISVLILGRPTSQYSNALTSYSLGQGIEWSVDGPGTPGVLVETVKRFKGLESLIVFLWLALGPMESDDRELLYVGISRAKSRLYLIGTKESCASVGGPAT